jgi:hypothetical protein
MDEFTEAYLECAAWTEELEGETWADDAIKEATRVCEEFQRLYAELLEKAYTHPNYNASRAGHDFWLTRNRHGAGFWDRGLGAVGDELTREAHTYGDESCYLGDDDRLHFV